MTFYKRIKDWWITNHVIVNKTAILSLNKMEKIMVFTKTTAYTYEIPSKEESLESFLTTLKPNIAEFIRNKINKP